MKKKYLIRELKPGMFIEELDRPWIETPYPLEGLTLTSQKDIDDLAQYCKHVYVTVEDPKPSIHSKRFTIDAGLGDGPAKRTTYHGNYHYTNEQSIKAELPIAKQTKKKAIVLMEKIKMGIQSDLKLDIKIAKELVNTVATSVIRNPDAMMLVNEQDNAHYERAVKIATYMIVFGRHLCLPPEELSILGLGGLLMDISLINAVQKATGMEPGSQNNFLLEHVEKSEEILSKIAGMPEAVLQITAQHHEREDGTGYPRGLGATEIVPYAQMANIVDTYERFTCSNEASFSTTPFEALKMLWSLTSRWLNVTLVEQFIYCIGVCPVGSLVELNTGEVGIVLAHNRIKRLLPRIMVVLDAEKNPYKTPWSVDLATYPETPKGEVYEIKRDLERGAYGINSKDYYL
ncbi:MAG: HD-GYP domain-containing protein [Legionella sp.]|nr:MAG: HD-GYP domain-containing protein [Legionella sp.]